MKKLVIKNLKKSYDSNQEKKIVLNNISFSIEEKEIVAILGPSGSGKTTLFNIISGVVAPDTGELHIDSESIEGKHGSCGYMFQEPLLFPWLTSIQNIALPQLIKRAQKKSAYTHATSLLKACGLISVAHHFPYQLSGGMKQRVALLRTIAYNSNLLLLDEPFGSLDAITRTELHYFLLELAKKFKLTILFTTHDIREALLLADRIIIFPKNHLNKLKEVKVDLKKPRKLEILTTTKSITLEKKLLRILKNN